VADGSAVAMSKVFNNLGNPAHSANFLLGTFGVACALCVLVALVRREPFGLQELLYGTMVGVPNFFAARFLLRALESIPAIIVYPTRCVGGIAIVALFGVLYFGERLRRHQWYAMAAITVAIVLLNL
jgi:multidrug transporter EmrE-like cation transporter